MGISKTTALAALLASVAMSASAAQPVRLMEAVSLGQSIAVTAALAERNAAPDTVQAAVRSAVQGAIIGSAADPLVVVAAFDQLGVACGYGHSSSGWTCPTSAEAFRALASVRSIVVAQIEQTDPAAFDTPGSAALGAVPSTSAGGSNYRGL